MVVLRTERVVAGGDVLARAEDGRVVFVRGAVPDETVEVVLREEKRQFARADVVGVIEAGADRVTEPCPRRIAGCGGCDWMHISPERQLALKGQIIEDAMRRIAGVGDVAIELGGSVPAMGYRTTMRLAGDEDGRLGLRSSRSHRIVHSTGCLVAHPLLVAAIDTIRVTPGLEITLRVSAATGELTALWDPDDGTVEHLPERTDVGPSAVLEEEIAGERVRLGAASFFQSGPAAAALLVETIADLAPEVRTAKVLVDAYGGVGMFARCLASSDANVLIVESSQSAASDAGWNCPFAHVHLGTVERPEATAFVESYTDGVDVVIADPTRRGLGERAAAAIAGWSPGVFVLVSCDPATFARDTTLLAGHGYAPTRVVALDLFPYTHHVESVARFTPL